MRFAGAFHRILRLIPCPHDARLHLGGYHEGPDNHSVPHLSCVPCRLRAANAHGGSQARAANAHAEADGHGTSHGNAHADVNRAAPDAYTQSHGHDNVHFNAYGDLLPHGDGNSLSHGHAPAADGDGHPRAPHSHPFADAHFAQHLSSLRVGAGGDAG